MKENQIVFDSVLFDLNEKTFTILNGSIGTYALHDVLKIHVLGESEKFKGKTPPFTHTVLTQVGVVSTPLFEPSFYIGVKITMKKGDVLAIYVSKKSVRINTDQYLKDMEEAEFVKRVFERKGDIKLTKKEKDLQKMKEQGKKFNELHFDLRQYWKGKWFFYVFAICFIFIAHHFHDDIKDWFKLKTRYEASIKNYEFQHALLELDELKSFDIVDHERGITVHIDAKKKKDVYESSYCEKDILYKTSFDENDVKVSINEEAYKVATPNISLDDRDFSFKLLNEELFMGKDLVKFDMLGIVPSYMYEQLPENNYNEKYGGKYDRQHQFLYSILRKYREKEVSEHSTSYVLKDILHEEGYTWSEYTFTYSIDRDGYLVSANLSFSNPEYEKYEFDYEFINFEEF